MEFWTALVDRLKEPSTYAGLSTASIALGIGTETMNVWVAGLAGVFAFLAIILKELRAVK